jgi:predicted nicotinamide N-methyase
MADTERRKRFMQLLRRGVQDKVQQQQQEQAKIPPASAGKEALQAEASGADGEVRRATLPESSSNNKHLRGVTTWQTLAWRDVFSMAPFFRETVGGRPLRVKQVLQGELNGFGTGLTVWPAACVLLKHLEHRAAANPKALADSDDPFVLELGSGTGAVGIAAAMLLRAGRVVLTDMDNVRFIMQENAALAQEDGVVDNHVTVDVEGYEWGQSPSSSLIPSPEDSSSYPDLILVSDCILPRLYPIEPLVDALTLLSRSHTRIMISYEHRHYQHFQPKDKFWELMEKNKFSLRVLDTAEYHPCYVAADIEVWEITRT